MPAVVPQLSLPGRLYACLKQKVDWVYLIFVPVTEASLASNYGIFILKQTQFGFAGSTIFT
jgi:hypothetical protein